MKAILKRGISAHLTRDLRQYVLALLAALQEVNTILATFPS